MDRLNRVGIQHHPFCPKGWTNRGQVSLPHAHARGNRSRVQDCLCGCRITVPLSTGGATKLCWNPDCTLLGFKIPTVLHPSETGLYVWKWRSSYPYGERVHSTWVSSREGMDWHFYYLVVAAQEPDPSSIESLERGVSKMHC